MEKYELNLADSQVRQQFICKKCKKLVSGNPRFMKFCIRCYRKEIAEVRENEHWTIFSEQPKY